MKKLLSVFLSALLLCASVFAVPVLPETTFSVLPSASAVEENGSEEQNIQVLKYRNQAIEYIRSQMIARNKEFLFGYTHDIEDSSANIRITTEDIVKHDMDTPELGDYLRFNIDSIDLEYVEEDEDGNNIYMVSVEYRTTYEQETAVNTAVTDVILPALAGINVSQDSSEIKKAGAIFNWLLNSGVDYDDDFGDVPDESYTAYGALVSERQKAKCEGFALAYYRLALELGLNCRILVGDLQNENGISPHAWNAVKIGNKWYNIDVSNAVVAKSLAYNPYLFFMMPIDIHDDTGEYQVVFQNDEMSSGSAFYTADEISNAIGYSFNSTPIVSGDCGENATWTFLSGQLIIEGTGDLDDFSDTQAPWLEYADLIKTIYIDAAVTNISAACFSGCAGFIIHCVENSAAHIYAQASGLPYHLLDEVGEEPTCETPGREPGLECREKGDGCFVLGGEIIPVLSHQDDDDDKECDSCGTQLTDDWGVCGNDIHWYYTSGSHTLVLSGTGDMFDYGSAASTRTPWYGRRTQIQSIEILTGISSIGNYAFNGCENLTGIEIREGVTSIGDYAFYNCKKLASIILPIGLISIGKSAFGYTTSLNNIEIPVSVTRMGGKTNGVFYKSTVSSVIFEGNRKKIPEYACYNAEYLTSVTIPSSVTQIGKLAFFGCKELTAVTLPAGLVSIGSQAFQDCEKLTLTDERLPVMLTTIGGRAFANSGITSVIIPATVKDMGSNGPFADSALDSIEFADGLKEIPTRACSGAANLMNVTIPRTVTTIGSQAFFNCEKIEQVELSEGLSAIGNGAFGNSGIKEITIPASVINMGRTGPFGGSGLTSIVFAEGMETIPDRACNNAENLVTATIPSTATSIGASAFFDCKALGDINIPKGVTSIKSQAFSGCASLTFVQFPETLKSINRNAFAECEDLKSVWIPASVTTLESNVFKSCGDLVIHCPAYSTAATYADTNGIACHTDLAYESEQIEMCNGSMGILNTVIRCNDDECDFEITVKGDVDDAGHTPGEWETVTPATCVDKGRKEKRCSVCGRMLDEAEIPATGIHKDSDGDGYCDNCGAELSIPKKKTIFSRIAEFFEKGLGFLSLILEKVVGAIFSPFNTNNGKK